MDFNNRQNWNRKILEELGKYVEKYPDYRFEQILFAARLVQDYCDYFYEEPQYTWLRMMKIDND